MRGRDNESAHSHACSRLLRLQYSDISLILRCGAHGIIHDHTTIQAFEMIEFPMRGIRSTAEHRDATDWAPFYRRWGGLFMVKLRQRVASRRRVAGNSGYVKTDICLLGHLYVGFGAPIIDLPQRPSSRMAFPGCMNLLTLRKRSRTLTTGLELLVAIA